MYIRDAYGFRLTKHLKSKIFRIRLTKHLKPRIFLSSKSLTKPLKANIFVSFILYVLANKMFDETDGNFEMNFKAK